MAQIDSGVAQCYSDKQNRKSSAKRRKYYRRCGICGERYEQSEMVRDSRASSGWLALTVTCPSGLDMTRRNECGVSCSER